MTPTSSQLDAAVGQFGPRERVVKPPTKSGEFLVCELCDAGKLADGIAVSTVNKTGSAANAWGEKPHSEAQAWCDLVEADRPLGVSKLFKYSCVVCVRTAQVFSRALDRPVVTASHGDEQNLSALHAFDRGEYFPIAKPSQSVLAAVRESGSHEGMRALVALAKGEAKDEHAALLYTRHGGADALPLGCCASVLADGVDPRQRRELLLTLHFSVLVSEYAAAVRRRREPEASATLRQVAVAQRQKLVLALSGPLVGLAATAAAAAAEQLLSPLIADGEWSAFSGQPAATPPAAKTIAPATEPRTVSLSTPPQRGEAVDFVVESVQETRHNGPVRLFANGRKFVCFGRYARGVRSGQRIRAAVERHEPSGRFGPQTVLDPATLRVGEAHKRPAGGAAVAVARPDMPVILSASPRTTTGAAPPAKSALRAESVVEVEVEARPQPDRPPATTPPQPSSSPSPPTASPGAASHAAGASGERLRQGHG